MWQVVDDIGQLLVPRQISGLCHVAVLAVCEAGLVELSLGDGGLRIII